MKKARERECVGAYMCVCVCDVGGRGCVIKHSVTCACGRVQSKRGKMWQKILQIILILSGKEVVLSTYTYQQQQKLLVKTNGNVKEKTRV